MSFQRINCFSMKSRLFAVLGMCVLSFTVGAQNHPLPPGIHKQGMFVRIYSIDGSVNPFHMDLETNVRPGDQVRLAADLYDQDSGQMRQGRFDFIWSIGDGQDCDLSYDGAGCPETSSFRPVSDGVILVVPATAGKKIVVTATSREPRAMTKGGKPGSDAIVLRNLYAH